MCIMFVYINNDPDPFGYRLIVINNRDEYYNRPTAPAAFWGPKESCLSGVDLQPGREGGTWFGATLNGKVGALLNILTPSGPDPNLKPRGNLVRNYLTEPISANKYLASLETDAKLYNAYNLVLLEKGDERWKAYYYSNASDSISRPYVTMEDGLYGVSNSIMDKPFNKVVRGQSAVQTILDQYSDVNSKEYLYKGLFDVMADSTCNLPDPQMSNQGCSLSSQTLTNYSGIYVDTTADHYGTRTTTLLTVMADDYTEYIEKTMREPINSLNPVWDSVAYNFHQHAL